MAFRSSFSVCCCLVNKLCPILVTLWTPLSMGFSRQEYWSEMPFPSPRDLPDPGIKLRSLMAPALAGGFFTTSATWEYPHAKKKSLDTDLISFRESNPEWIIDLNVKHKTPGR